jgi:hypothetical protein
MAPASRYLSKQGGGSYAKALAEEIVKPGIEAVTMFRNVQLKVKQALDQDPWLRSAACDVQYVKAIAP